MGASFNGRTQVSKTCNVGSIPTAPAKGVRRSPPRRSRATGSKTFILGSNPSARAIAKAPDLVSVDFAIGHRLGFEGQERSVVILLNCKYTVTPGN